MKKVALIAIATAFAVAFSSCSSVGASTGSQNATISFELWNPNQLPSYQECAVGFKAKTGITVKVEQAGWTNYWSNLITNLSAGTAPDVFLDHVLYYKQLQSAGQLVDLNPYFQKDGFDGYKYDAKSNELWVMDGKRYAVSEDQDVEGLAYNTKDIPADVPIGDLSKLTWNYNDGGTFQKMIEHPTIDKNGNRGDSPNFDKSKVKTYGFALESGPGVTGQTQWSAFLLSTGFQYTNKNPGGTEYNLNDPRMAGMWTWLQKMYAGGVIASVKLMATLGPQPVLDQNVAAMMVQGSWVAPQLLPSSDKAQTYQWAQLPSGPLGHPVSITNSTGPSVTTSSKHPAEAAKWVEYIVSPACADVVAASGAQIPTIPEAADKALSGLKTKGVDTSSWKALLDNPESLRYYPITNHAAEINALANTAFDDTLAAGTGSPKGVLDKLKQDVNALLAGG